VGKAPGRVDYVPASRWIRRRQHLYGRDQELARPEVGALRSVQFSRLRSSDSRRSGEIEALSEQIGEQEIREIRLPADSFVALSGRSLRVSAHRECRTEERRS